MPDNTCGKFGLGVFFTTELDLTLNGGIPHLSSGLDFCCNEQVDVETAIYRMLGREGEGEGEREEERKGGRKRGRKRGREAIVSCIIIIIIINNNNNNNSSTRARGGF